jgi:ABC-type multidrug transport system ATPase subunit
MEEKPTPISSAAVSIRDLVRNYGSVKALQGLSQTIETGQIFCLLGPNGAGKTTLIKAIVGAVRPASGVRSYHAGESPTHKSASRIYASGPRTL